MTTTQKWNGFGPSRSGHQEQAGRAIREKSATLLADAPRIVAEAQAKGLLRPGLDLAGRAPTPETKCRGLTPGPSPLGLHCSRCGRASDKAICLDCLAQIERAPDAQELLGMVCKSFGVGDAEIFSVTRRAHATEARQVLAYCLRRICGWSYSRIGRFIGRGHDTVIHAEKVMAERIELYAALREKVLLIEAVFAKRANNFSRGTKAQTAAADPLICTAPAAVVPSHA